MRILRPYLLCSVLTATLICAALSSSIAKPALIPVSKMPHGSLLHFEVDTAAKTLVVTHLDNIEEAPAVIPLKRDSLDGRTYWNYADMGGHEEFEKITGGVSEALTADQLRDKRKLEGKGDDIVFINMLAADFSKEGILLQSSAPPLPPETDWLMIAVGILAGMVVGGVSLWLLFRKQLNRIAELKRREMAAATDDDGKDTNDPEVLKHRIRTKDSEIAAQRKVINQKEIIISDGIVQAQRAEKDAGALLEKIKGFQREADISANDKADLEKKLQAANAGNRELQREIDTGKQLAATAAAGQQAMQDYFQAAATQLVTPLLKWMQSSDFRPIDDERIAQATEQLLICAVHYISLVRSQVGANVAADTYNVAQFGPKLVNAAGGLAEPKSAPLDVSSDEYPELLLAIAALLRNVKADGRSMNVSVGGYTLQSK